MNHSPVMNVDQPLSNAYELEYFTTVNEVEMAEVSTYEFEPIYFWMRLHKVIDIPIRHPG